MEMMRLLLAAGADPKVPTKSNMTAIAAATGVNRVQGESNVTEAQAFEVVKFLIELGCRSQVSRLDRRKRDLRRCVSWMELGGATARGPWHGRERDQQIGHDAVARRIGSGRSAWRRPLQHGDGGAARQARRGSDARQTVYGADEVSVRSRRSDVLVVVLGAGCWVLGAGSGFTVQGAAARFSALRTQNQAPAPSTQNAEPRTADSPARELVTHVLRFVP